jgi:hypothetical protein
MTKVEGRDRNYRLSGVSPGFHAITTVLLVTADYRDVFSFVTGQ